MIIEDFNMSTIEEYSNYIIIGSKSSGKTTVIRDLIDANRHLFSSIGTYITRTDEEKKHIMESNIENDKIVYLNNPSTYMDTITTEILNVLVNDNDNMHIALDDILLDPTLFNEVIIQELVQAGKIKKTCSIFSFDYIPRILPDNTKHIDYIFLSNNLEFEDIDEFYNMYVIGFTFLEFISIHQLLGPYDFLVINNISHVYSIYNSIDDSLHDFSYNRMFLSPTIDITGDLIYDDILSGKINIGVDI